MNKKSILLSIFLIILVVGPAMSQRAKLNKANRYFSALNYQDAVQTYLEVLDKRDVSEAKIKLAECYRKIGNMSEAEYWFGQVVRLPEAEAVHKLYYGMALQSNGKCEEAKQWFEAYTIDVPDDLRGKYLMESCETAVVNDLLTGNASFFEIEPIPEINSDLDDFGPAFFGEGIVFASERDRGGPIKRISSWTGNPFLEMYFTEAQSVSDDAFDFAYTTPEKYSSKLNTKLHDGPLCFSVDESTVYFTRNNLIAGKLGRDDEGIVRLKVLSAKLIDGQWVDIKGLPFNSDEYSVAHPTLSADGNTLFFASDMPGGFGGMDLYQSTQIDGRWSPPINMNVYIANINTEGDEIFPAVHPNGNLYFSSNGHTGLGGLDIFMAMSIGENTYGPVTNLGFPLNSIADDFGLVLNNERTFGYFTSNREGGVGNDDIYSLKRISIDVEVLVFDELTGDPIEGAEVVYDCAVGSPGTSDVEGKLYMEVALNKVCEFSATKDAYDDNTVSATTNDYKPGDKIFVQIPMSRPLEFALIGTVVNPDGEPVEGATITLTTDCGDEPFVVLSDENGNYDFDLDPDCCYLVKADKENYLTKSTDVCTRGQTNSVELTADLTITPFRETIDPSSPVAEEVIIAIQIPRIYYDFDRATLRKDASEDLATVLRILQANPDVIIEIGSHTDARGPKSYNMRLSARRAESVVRYMRNNGIDRKRLLAKGYGETRPVNGCIDGMKCSAAQHQENRRTEMRVVGTISGGMFEEYLNGTY
ncbi:MAG: OmpA family protein [Bacteroidota bacterium]